MDMCTFLWGHESEDVNKWTSKRPSKWFTKEIRETMNTDTGGILIKNGEVSKREISWHWCKRRKDTKWLGFIVRLPSVAETSMYGDLCH